MQCRGINLLGFTAMMQHNTRTKIINILNNEIPVFQINAFLFYVNEYKKKKKNDIWCSTPPLPPFDSPVAERHIRPWIDLFRTREQARAGDHRGPCNGNGGSTSAASAGRKTVTLEAQGVVWARYYGVRKAISVECVRVSKPAVTVSDRISCRCTTPSAIFQNNVQCSCAPNC